MDQPITQEQAKLLICDYLRETGRRGVTSLMRDLSRYARTAIFAQRTLELWLKEPRRQLQDENWELVLGFIQSEQFRKFVPYANEGPAETRLVEVGDGLVALYASSAPSHGRREFSPDIGNEAKTATKQLTGSWENVPNLKDRDVPRTICKMDAVEGKQYAKFAYMALFRSRQISATGLVIYLGPEPREDADYCHSFILQLWRRRDPESGTRMPGALFYLRMQKNQPTFAASRVLNSYFYKEQDPVGARSDIMHALEPDFATARAANTGGFMGAAKLQWALEASEQNAVMLRKVNNPIPEEESIIDRLLEDVLPHGYSET